MSDNPSSSKTTKTPNTAEQGEKGGSLGWALEKMFSGLMSGGTIPTYDQETTSKFIKEIEKKLDPTRAEMCSDDNSNSNASAAASSSPSTTTTTLTAEEAEKILQEAAPLFTNKKYSEALDLYSKVVGGISLNEDDATLKQILSRGLSNRSGCFLGLKKPQEALEDANQCVGVRPSWVRAHLRVAIAAESKELEEHQVDLVISAYQSAIKAEDRSGAIPSQEELENSILRVQQKQFERLMKKVHKPDGSVASDVSAFVRDTMISAAKYCTTTDSVYSFCRKIAFHITLNVNNKILFGTAAVRDALLTMPKYCTTVDSADLFCGTIANLAFNNEANTVLLSTASVRDALLSVSKYCTTDGSATSFCGSIGGFAENHEPNKVLFGTASVRDAIVAVSKYCTSKMSAVPFCASIANFTFNDNNKILFGTASVRNALLTVSKYCTTAESADYFCRVIVILAMNENNRILFGTASVRDALLSVSKYCITPNSVGNFCRSISNLTLNGNNKVLFGNASVRGALLAVSKNCTSTNPAGKEYLSYSADNFCGAIANIIDQNESNLLLFGTEVIRDAVLSASAYIDFYYGVCTCCRVIHLFLKWNPTLFCVEETVTCLVKLSKIEMNNQSPESIYWFLNAVLSLLHSDKKLFNTTEIRVSVERFQEVVNDPEEVEKLKMVTTTTEKGAVDKLSNEEYIVKARQLCVEFQKVVSGKSETSSSAAAAVSNNYKHCVD